jgi:hypothetical protein
MRRTLLLASCLVILSFGARSTVRAQAAPGAFDGLSFLLGTWDAVPDPVSGTGSCTFALDLQGHAIRRTNHADTPAASGRPAAKHDDLMVIYKDGATIKADYWDNEDHVIHYVITTPAPNTAVFLSPSSATTPGYRLTYTLDSPKVVSGQFDFSAPGTATFATYLSWKMNRR